MAIDSERSAKMAPVLDRIPALWGKYLPAKGWDDMLLRLDSELAEIDPSYTICQAKEKFATLRFYVQWSDDVAEADRKKGEALVDVYEVLSSTICEYCGSTENVATRNGGWLKTLCDKCAVEDGRN